MVGSIFELLLTDLMREGWTEQACGEKLHLPHATDKCTTQAAELQSYNAAKLYCEQVRELQLTVEKRMAVWLKMPFPCGSDFSWD